VWMYFPRLRLADLTDPHSVPFFQLLDRSSLELGRWAQGLQEAFAEMTRPLDDHLQRLERPRLDGAAVSKAGPRVVRWSIPQRDHLRRSFPDAQGWEDTARAVASGGSDGHALSWARGYEPPDEPTLDVTSVSVPCQDREGAVRAARMTASRDQSGTTSHGSTRMPDVDHVLRVTRASPGVPPRPAGSLSPPAPALAPGPARPYSIRRVFACARRPSALGPRARADPLAAWPRRPRGIQRSDNTTFAPSPSIAALSD
jgi:hypothetical protein